MARKLVVEIIGDASSLEKAFGKAGKESDKFSSGLRKVGKAAAFTAGGAALGGLLIGLKRGIDEFSDSQKQMAQTQAALRSTGKAAGVTAKHVTTLASNLSALSGVDDEVIQSGENLLLTFTNIRNGVGKGNDIFDKATATVLDMSVALGQDTKASAIQLGKALNDPVKGITALTRVGVTFTEKQKNLIKGLSGTGDAIKDLDTVGVHLSSKQKKLVKDMGDTTDAFKAARLAGIKLTDAQLDQLTTMSDGTGVIKAQNIVLKELQKEFGGSAKAAGDTFSGSLNKLKNSFDEVAGAVVAGAAPAIQKYADRLNVWLSKAENQKKLQDTINGIMRTAGQVIQTVSNVIKTLAPIVQKVVDVFGGWKNVLLAIIALKVASKIAGIADSFVTLGGKATTAKGQVGGLATSLRKLPKGVSIPLLVTAGVIFAYPWVKKFFENFLGADFSGLSKEPSVSIPNPKRRALHGTQGMSSAHTGTGPTVSGGPFRRTQGVAIHGPVTVVANNPQEFITAMQRWARRQSPSRSGPFGGHNLGLT